MAASTVVAAGWSTEETKALISVWGQANVQSQLDGVQRNRVIFEGIAREMDSMGYSRTWKQCRTKLKNITQKYRKVKDVNRVSGGERVTCPFFDEIDAILGTRAASTPPILLQSSGPVVDASQDLPDEPDEETSQFSTAAINPILPASCSPGPNLSVTPGHHSACTAMPVCHTSTPVSRSTTPISHSSTPASSSALLHNPSEPNDDDVNRDASSLSGPSVIRRQGTKRRLQKDGATTAELSIILSEMEKQADARMEERERKRILLEGEIEEKRRAEERRHEREMHTAMLTFMERILSNNSTLHYPTPLHQHNAIPLTSYIPHSLSQPNPHYSHVNPSHSYSNSVPLPEPSFLESQDDSDS